MTKDYGRQALGSRPRGLWLAGLLSVLAAFGAAAAWSSRAWPLPYGERALGTVTSVKIAPLPIRPGYLPTVDYLVGGVPYRVTARIPTLSAPAVGAPMTVDYDAKRPARAALSLDAAILVALSAAVAAAGVSALALGLTGRKPRFLTADEKLSMDLYDREQ